MKYYIILYYIILYPILSYPIVSYPILSYPIISYHIISYHIISYHIISYQIISYHIILYYIIRALAIFLKTTLLPKLSTLWFNWKVTDICDEFAGWRKFRDCTVMHNTQGGSPFNTILDWSPASFIRGLKLGFLSSFSNQFKRFVFSFKARSCSSFRYFTNLATMSFL